MLKNYGRQLTSARRLARFKKTLDPEGRGEETAAARLAKRRLLVEQVSREIVENLVVSGSENEVVVDILEQVETEFGEKFEFAYPPAEIDLQVFRMGAMGPEEVTGPAKQTIFNRLWEITLDKVNQTML